jgi:hypothetical protein
MIKPNNRAFLLLEVLVTVVIVSASIVFINHAFSSSLRAMSLSNNYRDAILFLQDRIFDIELNLYTEAPVSFSMQENFSGTVFSWEQEALPLERDDLGYQYDEDNLELKRLSCFLGWHKLDSQRMIELLTYIPIIESAGTR